MIRVSFWNFTPVSFCHLYSSIHVFKRARRRRRNSVSYSVPLIFSKINHDQSPPQATRGSSGSLAMRIAAQADALLQRADRNGDGKLSLGEWQLEYLAEKVDHGEKVAFQR